jgi:N-acylglucosamine 2-epimerase
METKLKNIRDLYENQLVEGELDFWLKYGMDLENGGIYTALDRDGSLLDTDKSVWFQGRALWTFATAYEKYGKKEYLDAATSLLKFIENHCFDKKDGRMYFRVTNVGVPVVKRIRYFFSETFTIIGFATYARITNKEEYNTKAYNLLEFVEKLRTTPGYLIPKFERESRGFGGPMILLNVLSELRNSFPQKKEWIDSYMDRLLQEVETYFVKDDIQLVLEQVAVDGSFDKDHFEGRLLNPGHAIEGAWFIMNEGVQRNRQDLIDLGLKMLDWMWSVGWDEPHGGIIQYRDALNKSLGEYHQDMKFWWPQCEAAIATLMAYSITHKQKYLDNFYRVNDYIQEHFIDSEFGEWYGYFHRDGTLATPIKGNMYKGPFHIPRMYFKCIELIDDISKK